ncbi:hypothetical protein MGSAQ_002047 [marine sediment metagenome]|uniref:Uncharacterized protein n=1 Tax=marine sediment metagenome TaxID=412755 RepID=A0A1B6NSZ5_9ZZZZ
MVTVSQRNCSAKYTTSVVLPNATLGHCSVLMCCSSLVLLLQT